MATGDDLRHLVRYVFWLAYVTMTSLLLTASLAPAQHGTTDGEWHTWAGDLSATQYAPLEQINAGNFSDLEVVWRFKTDNLGPSPDFNLQSTPLVINGVLYTTAGSRRAVVALDAATGEHLWLYRLDEGERAEKSGGRLLDRRRWRRAYLLRDDRLPARRA